MAEDAASDDRAPRDVLAEWRSAERELGELGPGSPEWHRGRLRVEELAAEYQARMADRDDIARDLASWDLTGEAETEPAAERLQSGADA
jgi:hypothetical protein